MKKLILFLFILVGATLLYIRNTNQHIDNTKVNQLIQEMTLEEKIGQMILSQLISTNDSPTVGMNEHVEHLIKDVHVGGIILFDKNIESIEQLTTFTSNLQNAASDIPLFISIDQEGGKSTRNIGSQLPGTMALGATRSKELAFETGKILGTELKSLGINVNFAPVLDINSNPNNPVIGVRSFGDSPELVAKLGNAYINGLRDVGIIPTAKHFPGHGDTEVDSHLGLPELPITKERLDSQELIPFKKAIENNVEMIMTSHITFPKIEKEMVQSQKDGSTITLPATLSNVILTEILREQLNFDGVIITDSLEMKAIAEHFGEADAFIKAIQAGADILLMPSDVDLAHETIVSAVRNGTIAEKRIDSSVKRILHLKEKYGLFEKGNSNLEKSIQNAQATINSESTNQAVAKMAAQAVTLLRNDDDLLPFQLVETDEIVLISKNNKHEQVVREWLRENKTIEENLLTINYADKSNLTNEDNEKINKAKQIIFLLEDITVAEEAFIKKINRLEKNTVGLLAGLPYDIKRIPNVKGVLSVYGSHKPNIKAGMNVIFGKSKPQGYLPVRVPLQNKHELEFGHGLTY